jgi:hypothetical protein
MQFLGYEFLLVSIDAVLLCIRCFKIQGFGLFGSGVQI